MVLVPVLIFELGNVRVFHYPTPEEQARNSIPSDVFWQDKITNMTYGPFKSTYDAMNHYSYTINNEQKFVKDMGSANVIQVDFAKKKRL